MIDEPAYHYFHNCHTCKKDIEEEFVGSHKILGHQVEKYITMPKKKEKFEFKPLIEDKND